MCQSLLLGTAKLILNVFNVVHFLVGAGLTGFGLYLELKYPSTFSEMTIGIGGFVLLTAMLGLFAVKKQNYCMLTSYSVFMALLFLANLIILIIAYVNFDTLMGKVDSQSSKVSKAKDWIRSHEQIYKYIQLGLVAVEFCLSGLAEFVKYRVSQYAILNSASIAGVSRSQNSLHSLNSLHAIDINPTYGSCQNNNYNNNYMTYDPYDPYNAYASNASNTSSNEQRGSKKWRFWRSKSSKKVMESRPSAREIERAQRRAYRDSIIEKYQIGYKDKIDSIRKMRMNDFANENEIEGLKRDTHDDNYCDTHVLV